jgi:integrase
MGLGSYPDLKLQAARKLALEAREVIAIGKDPLEERRRQEEEIAGNRAVPTFADAAAQTYESLAPSFRNQKHRDQWLNTLKTYVFPVIGEKKVDELKTSSFAEALRTFWLEKPETAGQFKQRCEAVMNWCLAHGHVDANPVPSVGALLPKQPSKRTRVVHHPAVPWEDLPALVETLQNEPLSAGRDALAFLILTAARSGEVRGARWDEIDFEKRLWVIPAERMKARRAHVVPLSAEALALLTRRQELCTDASLVFPSRSG